MAPSLDELLDQHVDAIDVEAPEAVEQQQGGVVFATVGGEAREGDTVDGWQLLDELKQ